MLCLGWERGACENMMYFNLPFLPFQSPLSTVKWAFSTLWDAASGRYLARQAAAAWRASRSPSPPRKAAAHKAEGARLRARG